MLAEDYLHMKREINEKGIIFSFSGYISEGILFALGDALKKKLSIDETDANTVKRVFSVFVEQAQNIIRYSAEKLVEPSTEVLGLSSGVITVGIEEGRFFVACGNVVRAEDVEHLRSRLERLQSMDPAGIKAYYLAQIREPSGPGSVGADIGLIEIARRASEPIKFDFTAIDADSVFYCMKAFI